MENRLHIYYTNLSRITLAESSLLAKKSLGNWHCAFFNVASISYRHKPLTCYFSAHDDCIEDGVLRTELTECGYLESALTINIRRNNSGAIDMPKKYKIWADLDAF